MEGTYIFKLSRSPKDIVPNPQDDNRMYVPLPREVCLSYSCDCSTTYCRDLTCVNINGRLIDHYTQDKHFHLPPYIYIGCYHSVRVTFCDCETEVETLMRSRLFAATPKQPQLAFTFELLDWFDALMLECQVPAQDFVAAIGILTDSQLMKVCIHCTLYLFDMTHFTILQGKKCNLYPVIMDSFEEYR